MNEQRKRSYVGPTIALFLFFTAGLAPDAVPLWPIAVMLIGTSVALGVDSARRRSVQHGMSLAFTWLAVAIAVLAERVGEWSTIGTVAVTLALLGTYLLPQDNQKEHRP